MLMTRTVAVAFIGLAVGGCASASHPAAPSAAESAPGRAALVGPRELSPGEQVVHALSRLTFGTRPGDAERVAAIGVDRWIDEQLHPESIPDTALAIALARLDAWSRPTSDLGTLMPARPVVSLQRKVDTIRTVNAQTGTTMISFRPMAVPVVVGPIGNDQVNVGKLMHAQLSEHQLFEVIADFWENHFSVWTGKLPSRDALPVFVRDAIRAHALGKFRDLLGAVAHSPAMLYYLDNYQSKRDGINENYARELLELPTLGVDGGYTQHDVVEVARALTGWSLDAGRPPGPVNPTARFGFHAEAHDSAAKVVLGHVLPAGRGVEDGEEVLDIVSRHPSTAHYIALKLSRHLVSDDPPASVVDRAAATFLRTDGDIAEVVRTIVTSPEFFSRAAFRAKVKTPFEFVVSALRAFDARPDTTTITVRMLLTLGQPMFGRLTPDGWPDNGGAWMNAGAVRQRFTFGQNVAAGKVALLAPERWEGWPLYVNADVDQQAKGVARAVLGPMAPSGTTAALIAMGTEATATPEARLRDMLAVAIGSPDFQHR